MHATRNEQTLPYAGLLPEKTTANCSLAFFQLRLCIDAANYCMLMNGASDPTAQLRWGMQEIKAGSGTTNGFVNNHLFRGSQEDTSNPTGLLSLPVHPHN